MFARKNVLSLALPLLVSQALGQTGGIQLDVTSQDSIKSASRSLAGGIIAAYNDSLSSQYGGVPGLFDGENDIYFWESGSLWNALLGYSYLTGDSKYDGTISQALQFQLGDGEAYMPANQTKSLGNDDQSCWGLAAMTAAEIGLAKPKSGDWVDYARNVWETQAARLKTEEEKNTCGGGLRWQIYSFNNGYTYKNTWTNGNYFLLSARLAKFTGNATYAQEADKIFKWSQTVGFVDKDFRVFDGADSTKNCSQANKIQWSATHGLYTEGAALMYNITGAAQNWTDTVKGFVNASSVFQSTKNSGVLLEVACERNGKCDVDQRAFKGVFARTFARAALAAPFAAESINKILTSSAKAAAAACTAGNDPQCSISWDDADSKWETATATDGNIGEVYDALEVIQALLYPSAKGLKSSSGSTTTGGVTGNSTQNAGASAASGSAAPQHTGAAGSIVASITAVFAVAIATILIC